MTNEQTKQNREELKKAIAGFFSSYKKGIVKNAELSGMKPDNVAATLGLVKNILLDMTNAYYIKDANKKKDFESNVKKLNEKLVILTNTVDEPEMLNEYLNQMFIDFNSEVLHRKHGQEAKDEFTAKKEAKEQKKAEKEKAKQKHYVHDKKAEKTWAQTSILPLSLAESMLAMGSTEIYLKLANDLYKVDKIISYNGQKYLHVIDGRELAEIPVNHFVDGEMLTSYTHSAYETEKNGIPANLVTMLAM
jgi:hypothetical protein